MFRIFRLIGFNAIWIITLILLRFYVTIFAAYHFDLYKLTNITYIN